MWREMLSALAAPFDLWEVLRNSYLIQAYSPLAQLANDDAHHDVDLRHVDVDVHGHVDD